METSTETQILRRQIEADISGLRWILENTNDKTKPVEILQEIARHKQNMIHLQHETGKAMA